MKVDIQELNSSIDVTAYLSNKGIMYDTEGKNVSDGWVGMNCPFCSDPSNHLGINLNSRIYNCFRCPAKGSMLNLIKEVEGCSFGRAIHIAKDFITYGLTITIEKEYIDRCKFPPEAVDHFPKPFANYLIERRFDPQHIIDNYGIKATLPVGTYNKRILIPYYIHGEMITFSSRSITNADPKYKHCPANKSVLDVKSTLYNLDNIDDSVIVTEGVTDVWRLGEGSCCISGSEFTEKQISMFLKLGLKNCFILFDAGATSSAQKLAYRLSPFIEHVEVVDLSEGDPCDLSDKEVTKLKNQLL